MPAKSKITPIVSNADLVDELGLIKAEISKAEKRAKEIIELLKTQGNAIYEGDLFDANVFASTSSSLDKEELCTKHKKMQDWLDECTHSKDTQTCKVTAKIAR